MRRVTAITLRSKIVFSFYGETLKEENVDPFSDTPIRESDQDWDGGTGDSASPNWEGDTGPKG